MTFRLRDADSSVRLFVTAFLLVLTAGYLTGLLFVGHTTSGTAEGLSQEYRGTPEGSPGELKYAKSADEMYIFLHNHVLSLSLVFFAIGGVFSFSSIVPPGLKKFLMVEPLLAIATTFGGIWLMRFVSEYFNWLVIVSGTTMACCYAAMTGYILWELWITPRRK